MKNVDVWHPSKFVRRNGVLRASYDSSELTPSSRFVADIVAGYYDHYLKIYASGDLIDLGCGKVPLYESYKDHVATNLCVDWENTLNKNPYIDLHCDLNNPLPFPDQKFDTILLSDVLEHVAVPETLWREMSRILRPGGKLILNVPFFYKLHEVPHDYYRYTEFALTRFAEINGLKIVLMTPMGGIPEIITDLTAKLVTDIPLIGRTFTRIVQWFGKIFIRTPIGKMLSKKTSRLFPLGYFMVLEKYPSDA